MYCCCCCCAGPRSSALICLVSALISETNNSEARKARNWCLRFRCGKKYYLTKYQLTRSTFLFHIHRQKATTFSMKWITQAISFWLPSREGIFSNELPSALWLSGTDATVQASLTVMPSSLENWLGYQRSNFCNILMLQPRHSTWIPLYRGRIKNMTQIHPCHWIHSITCYTWHWNKALANIVGYFWKVISPRSLE